MPLYDRQWDGQTDRQTGSGAPYRRCGTNDDLSKPKGKLLWSKYITCSSVVWALPAHCGGCFVYVEATAAQPVPV